MSSVLKSLKKLQSQEQGRGQSVGGAAGQEAGEGSRLPTPWAMFAGALFGAVLVSLLFLARQGEVPVSEGETTQKSLDGAPADPDVSLAKPEIVLFKETLEEGAVPLGDEFLPAVQQRPLALIATNPASEKPLPVLRSGKPFVRAEPAPLANRKVRSIHPPKVADPDDAAVPEVLMTAVRIPQPGYRKVAEPAAPDLPFLVSEIYYEEGGAANMAVVNELPTMEGTLVDGVLLKEILADRVVFEVEEALVSVPLSAVEN